MTAELAVAVGAALGAPSRYLLDEAVRRRFGDRLPWGTLAVNLLGSAVAGFVAGLRPGSLAVSLVAVGLLASFTTASALAAQLLDLWGRGALRSAGALLALHVVPGLGLAALGFALGSAL